MSHITHFGFPLSRRPELEAVFLEVAAVTVLGTLALTAFGYVYAPPSVASEVQLPEAVQVEPSAPEYVPVGGPSAADLGAPLSLECQTTLPWLVRSQCPEGGTTGVIPDPNPIPLEPTPALIQDPNRLILFEVPLQF